MSNNFQENKTKLLSDREHMLLRPELLIGSTDINFEKKFVLDKKNKIQNLDIEYVPALIKIVAEIINNSVDEHIRTNGQYANIIDIKIDENGLVTIRDNGRGIPSDIEEKTGLPSPVVCVTELKAGGNFEHDITSKTQGTFGVGSACTNIMSKTFRLRTYDGKLQTSVYCEDNLNPELIKYDQISEYSGKSFTEVQFLPDFKRFNRENFTIYEFAYLKKYLLDLSICYPNISFLFNDQLISCSDFKTYAKYYSDSVVISENEYCNIAIYSGDENVRISFVNGLHTIDGGTHVNHVINNIVNEIRSKYKKKYQMSPNDIYSNLHFIIMLNNITSPKFSSQTKEKLTTAVSKMKYAYEDIKWKDLSNKICRNKNIIDPILKIYKVKEEIRKKNELKKKEKNVSKTTLIPKLIEPSEKNKHINRLYLAEGDSALNKFAMTKSPFMGGFPLRGKFISSWNKSAYSLMENAEVYTLCKVLGLKLSDPDISNSNYSEICIMTDSDEDGAHISSLLISFIYKFWPKFFENKKVFRCISPLIVLENGKIFYSLTQFKNYQQTTDDISPMVKYNKGLGSLSTEDYEIMLNTLQPITMDDASKDTLKLAFDKKLANKRKKWLM